VHPNYQEEIDYVVKDISKVREQLVFDSFQYMIAGKILHESAFLCGSAPVFEKIKGMVEEFEVSRKLASLEKIAEEERKQAENSLLQSDAENVDASILHLFYTREEGDEIY
jgi:ferredoxin-NADP reductase